MGVAGGVGEDHHPVGGVLSDGQHFEFVLPDAELARSVYGAGNHAG
jgi:hypothetical protein